MGVALKGGGAPVGVALKGGGAPVGVALKGGDKPVSSTRAPFNQQYTKCLVQVGWTGCDALVESATLRCR